MMKNFEDKQNILFIERLQLHPELDLLHHGPVQSSVQMPQRRTAVHWVLLLGKV